MCVCLRCMRAREHKHNHNLFTCEYIIWNREKSPSYTGRTIFDEIWCFCPQSFDLAEEDVFRSFALRRQKAVIFCAFFLLHKKSICPTHQAPPVSYTIGNAVSFIGVCFSLEYLFLFRKLYTRIMRLMYTHN